MTRQTDAFLGESPPKLREIDDLPGPRGLPVIGNLFQIDRPHIHATVEAWARRYGKYFRFRIGRRLLFVVADHTAMATVLRDRPAGFRRTQRLEQIGLEMGMAAGVFSAEGEAWRRQRRMVMAGFDPRHLHAYFASLVKVSERLEGRWRRAAESGQSIDLQPDLMRFTVDAVAGLAFGADVNTLESDDDIIQRHLDKIFPALFRRLFSPFPTWRWWKTAADGDLDRSIAAIRIAIHGFITAARDRLDRDPDRRSAPCNLLEAMIVAADDPGSGITDAEVAGNVVTMLLAGEDTTANTLAWMIYLMHRHPASLERARAEIDAVLGPPAQWTIERFAELEWLDACANETMRLKPVAPFMALEALRETTIADIRVPAGTIVWGALRSDNMSEASFAAAARFEPARWLESAAVHGSASAHRIAMPFGAGPRVCPGRHLATLEMKIAMATLLRHFDIDSVGTADGNEPEERMAFTMAPVGLVMRLHRR